MKKNILIATLFIGLISTATAGIIIGGDDSGIISISNQLNPNDDDNGIIIGNNNDNIHDKIDEETQKQIKEFKGKSTAGMYSGLRVAQTYPLPNCDDEEEGKNPPPEEPNIEPWDFSTRSNSKGSIASRAYKGYGFELNEDGYKTLHFQELKNYNLFMNQIVGGNWEDVDYNCQFIARADETCRYTTENHGFLKVKSSPCGTTGIFKSSKNICGGTMSYTSKWDNPRRDFEIHFRP